MKRYLNKDEKDSVLILESFVGFLENHVKKLEELKKPKSIIKFAKMSKSFCYKVLDWYFEGLDHAYIKQLVEDVRKMEVVTKYRKEAVKEYEDMKKIDSNSVIPTDDLFAIYEHCMVICMYCNNDEEAINKCKLKDIFIRNDAPVMHTEVKEGECPYQLCKPGELRKVDPLNHCKPFIKGGTESGKISESSNNI